MTEEERSAPDDAAQALVSIDAGPERDGAADATILKHMGFAMGGGAIPIPVLDLAAVTAVQLDLLKRLAVIYDVALDGGSSRAFLTSLTGALGASAAGRLGASLAKVIPGVGTIGGGIAQVVLTGATTYAIGQLFKRVFREGRSLADLEVADVRDELDGYLEAGRERAQATLQALRRPPRDR